MTDYTIANTEFDKRRIEAITDRVPSDADRILDVGCVRHDRSRRAYGNLHAHLYGAFPDAEVVGLDMPGEETQRMQSPGYDIREGDACQMYLDGRFDAIVAGEVIEHMHSPGRFFARAEEHLRDGGCVVVSTPNPTALPYVARHAVGNWTSDDHTCWIDPNQLGTLVERSTENLAVDEYEYLRPPGPVSKLLYRIGREQIGAGTYVAVVR